MKKWVRNGLILGALSAFLLFPASASAETPGDANGDGYYDGDVAVINSLIENNGLPWTPDAPAEWETFKDPHGVSLVSWVAREDGLEHITRLNIGGNASEEYANCLSGSIDLSDLSEVSSVWIGPQEGVTELDLSGLTKLEELNVQLNTNLTVLNLEGVYSLRNVWITGTGISSLDMAGNTDLQRLTCQSNRLTSLNVSGLVNLQSLDCQVNQLTSLDVSGLTSLTDLRCAVNNITNLDMAGLTNLSEVWITGNPYESITFPDGDTLTMSSNEGGFISTWNVDLANDTIQLMPQSDDGYFFARWDSIPADAEYTENGANTIWGLMGIWKISVNGDIAVSGTFSPVVQYTVLEGEGSVWNQGSQNSLTVRADGELAKFTGVMVDDVTVDPQYYTATSGSTIVSLKPEFMQTLAAGAHTMSILFDDGMATVGFQVNQTVQEGTAPVQTPAGPQAEGTQNSNGNTTTVQQTPQTGDNSLVIFAVILMLFSGISAAAVLRLKTK